MSIDNVVAAVSPVSTVSKLAAVAVQASPQVAQASSSVQAVTDAFFISSGCVRK